MPEGVSLHGVPSGAVPVHEAYGNSLMPAGTSLVVGGVEYAGDEPVRCEVFTKNGSQCKNAALEGETLCGIHKRREKKEGE